MKVGGREIDISNLDKVLFPDAGITKGDLVDYYRRIAATMLPDIQNRPLTLHRFPDGIADKGFYQQNASDDFPGWIARVRLPKEDGEVEHCVCNDAASVVYLAGQACITPHAWLARADRSHHPDRMIFDLDPTGDDFATVRLAARTIRDVLDNVGLTSFVMTTGSRTTQEHARQPPLSRHHAQRLRTDRSTTVRGARQTRRAGRDAARMG